MPKVISQITSSELESFTVDSFRPEDAEGMVQLFHKVYGEHYPTRLFYNPDEIIAANRDGRYYSFVARTQTGKVIGTSHLFLSAPYRGLYESGVSLVLKEYRNTKAFTELLSYQYDQYIHKNPHIEEVWGEAVCNHVISQKMMAPSRFIDTAIELALMPAESYMHEKSSAGRVATLDAFRCYISKPHRIFVPRAYDKILRRIYARLDDKRDIAAADGVLPDATATKAEMTIYDIARVARIAVLQLGGDFAKQMSRLEEQARSRNTIVFQVWLNLTEPWVDHAVAILHDRGYFFGGALPRWFDGDGLLMQKLACSPDFEGIVLWQDFSKELLMFIQQDWERAMGRL